MTRTIMVTGTDTGVGKTAVATGLVHLLLGAGGRVAVLKPAETGCIRADDGTLIAADADGLAEAAAIPVALHHLVCPFRYPEPLAPAVAARRPGATQFDLATLFEARGRLVRAMSASHVVVEGAGGLLVPYSDTLDGADLARALKAELLVVARPGLGTLNHTALTIEAARARHLPVIGIILVHTTLTAADPAIVDNPAELRRMTGIEVAVVPYVPGGDRPRVIADELARAGLVRL